MSETDFGPEVRGIIERLAAVDLTDGRLDREGAEAGINLFLERLGIAPKPVRWAEGPRGAESLVLGRRYPFASVEISSGLSRLARMRTMRARQMRSQELAVREASAAYKWRAWSAVSRALSEPEIGPRSGEETYRRNRERNEVWTAARNAAYDASTAACELARLWEAGDGTTESRAFAVAKLPLLEAFEAGLFCYWVTRTEVFALRRPELYVDAEGRLHADGRAAVAWPDGARLYALHGVLVPAEIALTPGSELNPRLVVRERNVEVRRELVRKIGLERLLVALGAKSVDKRGDYELLMLELGDGRARPFLKMRNPSVPVWHVEGVHPDCRTVAEALAWRNGTDVPPSVLT